MKELKWISALVVATIFAGGCYTNPLTAVSSTIPVDIESKRLTHIGEVEGRACTRNILFLIPLATDGSIHTAKKRALASVKPENGRAIGLIDVSIDVESTITILYNQSCTIIRGKAVGLSAADTTSNTEPKPRAESAPLQPSAPATAPIATATPVASPADPAGGTELSPVAPVISRPVVETARVTRPAPDGLALKRSAVMSCLARTYTKSDVNLNIHVSANGSVRKIEIAERLPGTTAQCVSDTIRSVSFKSDSVDYRVVYRFSYKEK